MHALTETPTRPSLAPLLVAIVLATGALAVSGCTEPGNDDDVASLTPLTEEARTALNKGATTSVQFRFHGDITDGNTLCLQIDGYAAIAMNDQGDKFKQNVALPLPDTFDFYYFESTASDCSFEFAEVWPGPRETIVAALNVAPLTTACAPRTGGGYHVEANITAYNTVSFTGGEQCPTAEQTRVLVYARDLEESVGASEQVCVQVDGDPPVTVADSGGRFNHFVDDVPYNSTVEYRFFVSSESDCSTISRPLRPGDADLFVAGSPDTDCVDNGGEYWHSFDVDGSGTPSVSSDIACPASFGEMERFDVSHAVGDGAVGDELGTSTAIAGARMIIGADRSNRFGRYAGAAYVYRHDRVGGWTLEDTLTPASHVDWDRLGCSASMTDSLAAVGAWQRSPNGAVAVFERSGTTWTETALLTPSDGNSRDAFGSAVAVTDEAIVVGAPEADRTGLASTGSAYIFEDLAGWTETTVLSRSGTAAAGDRFGAAVAADGDVAVVGSPGEGTGAVYVYRNSGGTWSEETVLTVPEGESGGAFGSSVAVLNTRIAVGSIGGSGAVFIFDYDGSWSHSQTVTSASADVGGRFGEAIGLTETTLAVGAFRNTPGSESRAGSLHLFTHDGTEFTNETVTLPGDSAAGDRLGFRVAASPSRVIAGAPRNDGNSTNAGSVYLFD